MTPRLHALILLAFAALLFGLPGVGVVIAGMGVRVLVRSYDEIGEQ